MSFEIEVAREGDLLVVAFVGRIHPNEYADGLRRFLDILMSERPARILVDNRRLDGRADLAETYFLVRTAPPTPDFVERAAILEREAYREYAEFQQTTANNFGLRFTCFFDEGEARQWLAGNG